MTIRSRRSMLMAGIAGSIAYALSARAQYTPQYRPSPNAPANENAPAGLDSSEIIHPEAGQPPNTVNQAQIVTLVHRLYKLSGELQDEVDHTDIKATFPLTVVKKAQQIEKLAKQIKERAKG